MLKNQQLQTLDRTATTDWQLNSADRKRQDWRQPDGAPDRKTQRKKTLSALTQPVSTDYPATPSKVKCMNAENLDVLPEIGCRHLAPARIRRGGISQICRWTDDPAADLEVCRRSGELLK
jgi:hypothetical protein